MAGWEFSTGGPPLYEVERDGKTWLARETWPDPAGAMTVNRPAEAEA